MIEHNTSLSFMDFFGKHLYMGLLQFAILMHIKNLKVLYCLWKFRRQFFLNVWYELKIKMPAQKKNLLAKAIIT
jgi:hypothetical protein